MNNAKRIPIPPMQKMKPNPSIESAVYYGLGDAALQAGDYPNGLALLQMANKADPSSIVIEQDIIEALWGTARSQNQDPIDMLKYGEDLITRGKFNEQILGYMADGYVLVKKTDKAIAIVKYLIKNNPSGMNYFRLFIMEAKYNNKIKTDLLEQALKRAGDNEYLLLAIADVYTQLDPSKAEMIFSQTYDTFKDDLSFKAMSNFYTRRDQKTKLINELKKDVKSLNTTQLQVYIELLYQTGQYGEIISIADYLIDEGNGMVLRYLFASAQKEKDFDLMTRVFHRIRVESDLSANDIGLYALAIGDTYLQKGDYTNAAQYFAQISDYRALLGYIGNKTISGLTPEVKSNLLTSLNLLTGYGYAKELQDYIVANTQFLLDDKQSAFETIHRVPDQYFAAHDMLPEAAQIYLAAGDDSLKALQLLNMRKVKSPTTNTLMGQFYMFEQKDSIAEGYFNREFVVNPSPDTLFFRYAATLADRHDKKLKEEALLDKAITIYPDNTEFLNWYGYLLVMQNKDLDKAEKLIRRAVEIDSTNGYYWDSLAWLYYLKGSYPEALEAMNIPMQQGTKNSVISYHLGEIFYKLNRLKDSKEYFKQCIDVNDDKQAVLNSRKALDTYHW